MNDITHFISAYQDFTDFLVKNRESRDIKILTCLRGLEIDCDKAFARLSQEEKDLSMRKVVPESGVILDKFQGKAVKITRLK